MSTAEEQASRWYYSEEDLQNLEYLEDVAPPKKGRVHEVIVKDPLSQLNAAKPIVLKPEDSVAKAVSLMKRFRYGSVLIVQGAEMVGIFTEKDLVVKTTGEDTPLDELLLREVMTPSPQGLEEDDSIAHALHLMSVGDYRHVPVLRDGKPVGFASIRGILQYIADNALAEAR